ncbi:MAG: hypothetical protein H7330_09205, partial [Hymenobacteraceae bacterium]|nr:hypothetical protein [Hymenobacteraceae bacterium]
RAGQPTQAVYLEVADEQLTVYPLDRDGRFSPDSARQQLAFPQKTTATAPSRHVFQKPSFDIDVLTVPFRYRPARHEVPPQLTTSFSGGAYVGYRRDRYSVLYSPTPIGSAVRRITHYGFSMGGFVGIGTSLVTSAVLGAQPVNDYEGATLPTGAAAIVAVDNLTVGLAIGADQLLDRNRRAWLYRAQPWVGVALGLNLN